MVVNKENTVDLGDLDEKHCNEDAQQSQGPNQPNNKGEPFHQSEASPPSIVFDSDQESQHPHWKVQ